MREEGDGRGGEGGSWGNEYCWDLSRDLSR